MLCRAVTVAVLLLASLSLATAFHHVSVLPGRGSARAQALSGACPSLRATPARGSESGPAGVTMGMRDRIKGTFAALGAALSIGVAAPPANAVAAQQTANPAPTEEAHQQPPQPMLLPSQVAHYQRMQGGGAHPVVIKAKKLAQDPRLLGVAGAVAAGGAGYVVFANVNKKKNDDFRKNIASTTNFKIDASILDEARINRPGAKTVQFTNAPKFGSYRPPPEKLMKDVKDKYKWTSDRLNNNKDEDDISSKINLDIFKKAEGTDSKKNGDIPNTNGDIQLKKKDLDAGRTQVELVDDSEGPKSADQKALEEELSAFGIDGMDEAMRQAMAGDPSASMDPAMMAAALPALQEQLAELMKGGITKEEVQEVKQSFSEMGIDLDDMFKKIDEMEKAGLSDAVGAEGTEFFKTLRSIINSA